MVSKYLSICHQSCHCSVIRLCPAICDLLNCKEIKSANPKGNQPWVLIGRTDAEDEAPVLWPPDVKIWLTEKDSDGGKDWGQEKEVTEDEMFG